MRTALIGCVRPPREPLDEALARGDALVLYEELEGLELIDTGPVIHPLTYLAPRSYLPVLTTLAPYDVARIARHEAYIELYDDTGVLRELIPSGEAQRRIEDDPDQQFMLLTGDLAIGQLLYGAARALPHAVQEVERTEGDATRLFPPSERRAWRIARAKRRRELLRAMAAEPDRARSMGITLVPVVPDAGPWSAASRAMAPLYEHVREAAAKNDESAAARAALQTALEALCVLGARALEGISEADDGNLG